MQPQYEVADVLRAVDISHYPVHQQKTLRALQLCRTAALGGHVDACTDCGSLHISYNSCRNRHCPKCQGHKRQEWIEKREADLLPCTYYHVVFTLPQQLNSLALHQPALVYNALFNAVWATLNQFGNHEGLQMGMISVLHTCLSRAKPQGGTELLASPAPALHCTGWRHRQRWCLEGTFAQR